MKMDLNLLPLFLAVSKERNFRAAADRMGVTRSAVSQAIRRLEDHLGTALVVRTTRSVQLTEAGARLVSSLEGPLTDIGSALDATGTADEPRGHLRLTATSIAEPFLSGPLLASFVARCPHVTVDVTVTDEEFDIVAHGFDAGVRLGEVIEKDMIAVPVSGEQRERAAAAPAYLAERGAPAHPGELVGHRCIGWRLSPEIAPHRWEFVEGGRPFDVAVEPQITTNDLRLMLRLALAGAGITFAPEDCLQPHFEDGSLVPLLEEFLPPFPGFFLYFPQRRNMAPKLRALIDHVRQWQKARLGG
ncbi:LysR family transcriptional regulator (plasmid) [Rhizobium sullae]|uniref:HTH-type transcriptional regulator TtuA n=1 Tax=Rhizobium sullae TaxID=50338 RepID=A0A2N0DGD3_RHISU|nr:LysR family transcriptional regulator [Rhizobium sullae]PKA45146.1 LysR family transcriptional regulator [Rhizobium sullae]UWU17338.1 LysR family transcriptional regulator [Rhizobium sullae]